MRNALSWLRLAVATAVLVVLTHPAVAAAAEVATRAAGEQAWWQALLVHVVEVAVAILTPVLGLLAVAIARRFKIKLEQEEVDRLAVKAMAYAEQKAKHALKAEAKKTSGAEKMDMALGFARSVARNHGLSEKATSKMRDVIEAKLGERK